MITKNQIKHVQSLHQKKFRRQEGLFIAEGEKVVKDLLASGWDVREVYFTDRFADDLRRATYDGFQGEQTEVSEDDLQKISALTTAQSVLAVAAIPEPELDFASLANGLSLVLDDIHDPGNLGTMLRIADWFGIKTILCSEETVECFNPKVVQGAMGSLFRVSVFYGDLGELFQRNTEELKLPVYGTVMDGENIFTADLKSGGFIIMGNESSGINPELFGYIDHKISIPAFHNSDNGPDSLNVAIAAGIVCAEFRRKG